MKTLINRELTKPKYKRKKVCTTGKVDLSERILSVIAGSLIVGLGVKNILKRPITAISGLTVGGALVCRGIIGHCPLKSAIEKAVRPEDEITIVEHRYFVK